MEGVPEEVTFGCISEVGPEMVVVIPDAHVAFHERACIELPVRIHFINAYSHFACHLRKGEEVLQEHSAHVKNIQSHFISPVRVSLYTPFSYATLPFTMTYSRPRFCFTSA